MTDANPFIAKTDNLELQFSRTMTIVRQLFQGKYVRLRDGSRIGMAGDFRIGFVMVKEDGTECIGALSECTLTQLNRILNDNEIFFPIPGRRKESVNNLTRGEKENAD